MDELDQDVLEHIHQAIDMERMKDEGWVQDILNAEDAGHAIDIYFGDDGHGEYLDKYGLAVLPEGVYLTT